jgi:ribonuclease P protein component
MLARKYRLPSSVRLKQASVIRTPLFSLRFISNQLPLCRFGFVVSKRIDKRAVIRNRTKRILRACFEAQLPRFIPGRDYVIIAQQRLDTVQRQKLEKQVIEVLEHNQLVT